AVTKRCPAGVSMSQRKRDPGGSMTGTTRIPKAALTCICGAMVRRMSRGMLGDVAEPVEVAWHNKKVLNFSFSVGRKADKWDRWHETVKSLAHIAADGDVGV